MSNQKALMHWKKISEQHFVVFVSRPDKNSDEPMLRVYYAGENVLEPWLWSVYAGISPGKSGTAKTLAAAQERAENNAVILLLELADKLSACATLSYQLHEALR